MWIDGGQSEKEVIVKDPERSLSRTQHLAVRNLMDTNGIMKLAPDTLLLMRVGFQMDKMCSLTKRIWTLTDVSFVQFFLPI